MMNPKEAKPGTACAWIAGDLRRERCNRLARFGGTEGRPAADTLWQARGTDTALLPRAELTLDQPILARMITDHGQSSAHRERLAKRWQGALQLAQFTVHGDAHALKDPRKIRRSTARAKDRADGIDQVIADHEGRACAPPDYLSPETDGTRFVGEISQRSNEARFVDGVQPLGGGGRVGAHPHVERCARPEREAAIDVVELSRRDAKIEQDEARME